MTRYAGKRNLQIAGRSLADHPRNMNEMMEHGTREQVDRLTQTFLPMKELDIDALQTAYKGKAGSRT